MKNLVYKLIFISMMFAPAAPAMAAEYQAGKHYTEITPVPTDTGDKIEILEFFWYGCPHCYTFEPYITQWKKTMPDNVEFVRVPAIFRPDWEVHARSYYALSNMGVIEDVHLKIFETIHKQRKRLFTKEQMVEFIQRQGIDKDKFLEQYNSFSVESMVRKAKKKQQAYRVSGVPMVAVNGKYTTSGSMAKSYENLLKIMDYLVARESK